MQTAFVEPTPPTAHEWPSTAALEAALPETLALRARFVATRDQRLPPLPSTALHGALGRALLELGCDCAARDEPKGRSHRAGCAYGELLEPPPAPDIPGLTDHAPAPLVLAPERSALGRPFLELRAGEAIYMRVTLIGTRAARHRALLHAALHRAATMGLGVEPGDRPGRPQMTVERIDALDEPASPPAKRALIDLLTPCRLVADGHVRAEIGAALLWQSLVRRADTLARLYGAGPIGIDTKSGPPFEIVGGAIRVVSVQRYSRRQGTRMTWPGVVGALEIAGDGLRDPGVWGLLGFAERVQMGKATTFGFGRVRVAATGAPGAGRG